MRGEVDMHMEHMLEDFRRLQTTMATVLSVKLELEKENLSWHFGDLACIFLSLDLQQGWP